MRITRLDALAQPSRRRTQGYPRTICCEPTDHELPKHTDLGALGFWKDRCFGHARRTSRLNAHAQTRCAGAHHTLLVFVRRRASCLLISVNQEAVSKSGLHCSSTTRNLVGKDEPATCPLAGCRRKRCSTKPRHLGAVASKELQLHLEPA